MAGFVERVQVIIEAKTQGAARDLKNMRTEVENSSGAFGKAKAAAGGIGTTISGLVSGPAGFAALGGAIVGFGVKSVKSFEDTALEAGKLADATGLTTEQASAMLDVFGDIGVTGDQVEGALGKMNKALGANHDHFAALGLIGQDTQQTFLNVIGYLHGIDDPTRRAAEATKLLGKSWQEVAPVIAAGASDLASKLDTVNVGNIMTEGDVSNARALQATFAQLGDNVSELTNNLGRALLPVIKQISDAINFLDQKLGEVKSSAEAGGLANDKYANSGLNMQKGVSFLADALNGLIFGHKDAKKATDDSTAATSAQATQWAAAAQAMSAAASGTDDVTKATEEATKALDDEVAALEQSEGAYSSMTDAVLASTDAAIGVRKANADFTKTLQDGKASLDDRVSAALKAADAADKLATKQAEANGQTLTAKQHNDILVASLQGLASQASGPTRQAIEQVITQLEAVPNNVPVAFNVDLSDWDRAYQQMILDLRNVRGGIAAAAGMFATAGHAQSGVSMAPGGGWSWVGEAGRELVHLPGGAQVVPHQRSEAMAAGGGSTVININVSVSGTAQPADVGKAIVGSIHAYERANGRKVLVA